MGTALVKADKALSLPDLTERINEAHQRCIDAANDALCHAREAGQLLLMVKRQLPHGKWGSWLENNFFSFSHGFKPCL